MRQYIDRSMAYAGYLELIDRLLADGKTTGANQSEAMVGYGRLNRQRMARLDKTVIQDEWARAQLGANTRRQIWLVITEGWCGDAAQNVPAIEKAGAASDLIETRYVLRDENLELMDQYLTGSARSIPKLIALDAETLDVLFTWGARPAEAQELFDRRKAEGVDKPLISEEIQRWYNADHGVSVQRELAEFVTAVQSPSAAAANN